MMKKSSHWQWGRYSVFSLLLCAALVSAEENSVANHADASWWEDSKESVGRWWESTSKQVDEWVGHTDQDAATANNYQEMWQQAEPETPATTATDATPPAPEVPANSETTPTEDTQKSGDWWQYSRETANQWWEKSRDLVTTTLGDQIENPEFSEVWSRITPKLSEIGELEAQQEKLPESSWFGRDQVKNEADINALLTEAVSILGISETANIRQRLTEHEQAVIVAREKIAEYRQKQISAPQKSAWQATVTDFDKKIANVQAEIDQHQAAIDQLKTRFVQSLERIGVRLTQEQLDLLMSSVVGDDIINSSIVYSNVRQISEQLMVLTEESGEDIEISRRYYGMYTVLLKILLHMQTQFIQQVDEQYLPDIENIMTEVEAVSKNTLRLMSDGQNATQPHLQANLAAQDLTLKTARLYRQHLQEQRAKMVQAKNKTRGDLAIAQNTFKTVSLSGELVNLLRTSQDTFSLLLNIEVPELLVFDNTQMKQEFALLTEKLGQ